MQVQVRPHAKAHKTPEIALRQASTTSGIRLCDLPGPNRVLSSQLEVLGPDLAPGVCCQKLGEAEAMVAGGVRDVFISNQVGKCAARRGSSGVACPLTRGVRSTCRWFQADQRWRV